jgi:CDP-diacylglycerol--glycerol-3-phosphate 3-phosphatidyltransferase
VAAPHRRQREHFWNLPNTITVFRTAVVPILLLLPLFPGRSGSQAIAWCFIVAAVSDLVDGWLARRGQMVTHIGKLLDPLADKLIVSTALIVMLAMGRIPVWATWMVVVIVGRELAVTGLRGIASADGQVIAAAPGGKIKAVVQNVAVGALLFHEPQLGLPAHEIGMTLLGLATALTLVSGYQYFAGYFRGRQAEGPGAERSS